MRIEQPGVVNDRITLLGRNESCVYLVDGKDEYAILGGGMTYIVPDVMAQIKTADIEVEKIKRLVLHHSHFDHVGIAPFLKQQWPWIKVTASVRAKELLAREDVVADIVGFNQMMLPKKVQNHLHESLDVKTIAVDETVAQGDVLSCGDLDFEVIDVPGHSSCSMAVYIPGEKVLSASDSAGILFGDRVFAAANSNFDLYQESLKKMAEYEVAIHLFEHYGALTQPAGNEFMKQSMADAVIMRQMIEEIYDSTRDEQKTVEALLTEVSKTASGYFLPKKIMAVVLGQMTRFIAKQHAAKKSRFAPT
jgi:glyoxylase-like metal-dependent hydrolase (beta-lactamase superfamily II)